MTSNPAQHGQRSPTVEPLELVLAGGAFLALLASTLLPPDNIPPVLTCPFHRVTGLPCGGCGLTRSIVAISHLRLADAWRLNPFGYAFYAFGLALLAWPLWRPRHPQAATRLLNSPWFNRAPILLVVALTAFGLARLAVLLLGAHS